MGFTYVIEHMEEDDNTSRAIPKWVELEYSHMKILAGQGSQVHFTHLSKSSCDTLTSRFQLSTSGEEASAFAHTEGVMDFMRRKGIPLEKVCLLDPKAEKPLAPEDGGLFEWFLFGGILGDDPPRDRTGELRVLGFPNRHLGPIQMTTDTALGVTKLVVQDQIPLTKISYVDHPTIIFNAKESVEMPFRYVIKDGDPVLPPGMRKHLHEDLNQSFEL